MIIIATLGPSLKIRWVLQETLKSGVDVVRFNFAHGNKAEFASALNDIRNIKNDVHILQDLAGKKIRVSNLLKEVKKVYKGDKVIFCSEDEFLELKHKEEFIIPLNISIKDILNDNIKDISMKDNTMNFKSLSLCTNGIIAKVVNGGVIRAGKGCNIKGFRRKDFSLTQKDRKDISWGAENSVDIVCQSFVEGAKDISNLKKCIAKYKGYNPKIFAKIETEEGIKNALEIIRVSDGIVIGRGDMVSETSLREVPVDEEMIIKMCKEENKDVIVGTHVLDSMINGDSANLPELEAIFNHVKMGVSGVLLAGETSIGRYPVKSVKFLKNIINYYERNI